MAADPNEQDPHFFGHQPGQAPGVEVPVGTSTFEINKDWSYSDLVWQLGQLIPKEDERQKHHDRFLQTLLNESRVMRNMAFQFPSGSVDQSGSRPQQVVTISSHPSLEELRQKVNEVTSAEVADSVLNCLFEIIFEARVPKPYQVPYPVYAELSPIATTLAEFDEFTAEDALRRLFDGEIGPGPTEPSL